MEPSLSAGSASPSKISVRFGVPPTVLEYSEASVQATVEHAGEPFPEHLLTAWWISEKILGSGEPMLFRIDKGSAELRASIFPDREGRIELRLIVLDPHGPEDAAVVHDFRETVTVEIVEDTYLPSTAEPDTP
jgi:hypothetical protein